MYELVYSSQARTDLEMTDIQEILETSKKFNFANEITGCLLYHNEQFTQILEGKKPIIQKIYSRIKQDRRHFDLKLLHVGFKGGRAFDKWNMVFMEFNNNQLGGGADPVFEKNLLTFSEFADKPTKAVKLFWEKVRQIIEDPNTQSSGRP